MGNMIYQVGSIKMIGGFTYSDRHNALASIFLVGKALYPYLQVDEMSLFKTLFPEIVLTASYSIRDDAVVNDDGTVDAFPGRFSVLLAIHEWGHLFELLLPLESRPSTLLYKEGILDPDGKLLTGPLGGLYNRDCGLKAPDNGRISDDWRVGYQLHPREWDGGNKPTEDWCDLWLAFVMGWFVDNVGGQSRKNWVSSHMVDWTKLRTG